MKDTRWLKTENGTEDTAGLPSTLKTRRKSDDDFHTSQAASSGTSEVLRNALATNPNSVAARCHGRPLSAALGVIIWGAGRLSKAWEELSSLPQASASVLMPWTTEKCDDVPTSVGLEGPAGTAVGAGQLHCINQHVQRKSRAEAATNILLSVRAFTALDTNHSGKDETNKKASHTQLSWTWVALIYCQFHIQKTLGDLSMRNSL